MNKNDWTLYDCLEAACLSMNAVSFMISDIRGGLYKERIDDGAAGHIRGVRYCQEVMNGHFDELVRLLERRLPEVSMDVESGS